MLEQIDPGTKKTYYSISEVCSQTSLEPHVLRYWESEFPQLRPKKNRAGNRAYRDKDIEIIEYIKFLLYDQQFTIPGAKKKLSEMKESDSPLVAPAPTIIQTELPIQPEEKTAAPTDDRPVPEIVPELKSEIIGELKGILQLLRK